MWYLLCREVLRLRGTIPRDNWAVLPDLFFYRDAEEIEQDNVDKAAAAAAAAAETTESNAVAQPDWDAVAAPGEPAGFVAEPTAQTLDWSADNTAGDWSADAPAPAGAAPTQW